jgi:hypothetical protein
VNVTFLLCACVCVRVRVRATSEFRADDKVLQIKNTPPLPIHLFHANRVMLLVPLAPWLDILLGRSSVLYGMASIAIMY